MTGTTKILVGTTKGAFILTDDGERGDWKVSGPFCELWPINHVIGDPKSNMLWAGGGGDWYGAAIFRSTDGGETWDRVQLANGQMAEWANNDPDFAAMIGGVPEPAPHTGEVDAVWSLSRAHGVLYAGTKPAHFFTSVDDGQSWVKTPALSEHPTRDSWNPGGAGLTLHTIVPHPERAGHAWIAISAAGVFGTEDNGASWDRLNRLDNEKPHDHSDHPAAGDGTETGHCVHNMVRGRSDGGDILYQQNHHGVFRSRDGGRSWHDITEGLPSTFGFPIAVDPNDANTIWTIPLNGDSQGRFPIDAAAAVWKSTDGGDTWTSHRDGLPQLGCYFTVLRQALSTDAHGVCGVYFGTNTGSVFGSFDGGSRWEELARHLPCVLSVETLVS